jgi:7-keto-8-aminopelargonate synthetase-like enzyme
VATAPAVRSYIETCATSHVFSNALSLAQAAAANAALRIAMSPEGARLRRQTLGAASALREALADHGLACPGPIVPAVIGDERVTRLTDPNLRPRGVAAMVVDYPVVPSGSARLRLQVMPSHMPEQAGQSAAEIAAAVSEARTAIDSLDAASGLARPDSR